MTKSIWVIVFTFALAWSFVGVGWATFLILGMAGLVRWIFPAVGRFRFPYWVLAALMLVPVLLLALPHAERLDCEITAVDIQSGRLWIRRYLFYVAVSSRIEDTEVSRYVASSQAAEWRTVNLFERGLRISPHYRFHGAESQIHMIQQAWEMGAVPEEQRRADAARLMDAWRTSNNYFGADAVVRSILDRAIKEEKTP